jgi:hypothetical protein
MFIELVFSKLLSSVRSEMFLRNFAALPPICSKGLPLCSARSEMFTELVFLNFPAPLGAKYDLSLRALPFDVPAHKRATSLASVLPRLILLPSFPSTLLLLG